MGLLNYKQFFLQHNTGYIFKAVFIMSISVILFIWYIGSGEIWILNQQKILIYIYLSFGLLQLYLKNSLFFKKKD